MTATTAMPSTTSTSTTPMSRRTTHEFPSNDIFDADEAVSPDSPPMKSVHPRYTPEPSPPLEIPPTQISMAVGTAVLVACWDDNRHPNLPRAISTQALPSASEDGSDDLDSAYSGMSAHGSGAASPSPGPEHDLKLLATSALEFSSAEPNFSAANVNSLTKDRDHSTESTGQDIEREDEYSITRWSHGLPFREERPILGGTPTRPASSPRDGFRGAQGPVPASTPSRSVDVHSPPATALSHGHEELPPLQMDSPRSDSNGHGPLPSIKAQLGDLTLNRLPDNGAVREEPAKVGQSPGFSRPPPVGLPRLSSMSNTQRSPPISPNDVRRADLPSPSQSLPAVSPYYYTPSHGAFYRAGGEYGGPGELPSAGLPGYVSAVSATSAFSSAFSCDPLNSFGGASQAGGYVCNFAGCTAAPFQTQYLLNSHANVHSSARPHYCSVPGCPRSEGGKGFKRKNEMIRHGLVHDSPGYVCPFCPDREHKYPRPDNLQRHVRVHHLDKDKDDPALREVLSQRPDGPSRGRRRRGVTT